jgi:hypothetical protein
MWVQLNNVSGRRANVHHSLSQTVGVQRDDLRSNYNKSFAPRRFIQPGAMLCPERTCNMLKRIGAVAVVLLSGLLLIYSASRSLNFISMTLPPERQVLAWFGLAALDIGLVVWLVAFLYGSHGWQRPVAGLMVIVDLIGAIGIFTADTWFEAGRAGLIKSMSQDQVQGIVILLCGIIAVNIAGAVVHVIADPEQMRSMAEEDAMDKIESETLKKITEQAEALAAELAPKIAADWSVRTRARYSSRTNTRTYQSAQISPVVPPFLSLNSDTELVNTDPKHRGGNGRKA